MDSTTLFYVTYAVLWVLVIFQALTLIEMVRQREVSNGSADTRFQAEKMGLLPTGTLTKAFEAPELGTGRLVQSQSWLGQPTLLVFVSPTCRYCELVANEVVDMHWKHNVRLVAVCKGERDLCLAFTTAHLPDVLALHDESGAIDRQFEVKGTPTALLLDHEGRVLRYGLPHSTSRGEVRIGLDELAVPEGRLMSVRE